MHTKVETWTCDRCGKVAQKTMTDKNELNSKGDREFFDGFWPDGWDWEDETSSLKGDLCSGCVASRDDVLAKWMKTHA